MPITNSLHALMILVVAGVAVGAVAWGQRAQDREAAGRNLGAGLLVLWILYSLYYLQPAVFAWHRSLPLQVCDLLALLAAVVLLRPFRLGRAVTYLSAVPLASQAILTPTGNQDPSTLRFWLYWGLHAGIVACSLYDVGVNRYRPTFRDYVLVLMVDVCYVVLILPLDIGFGWNYGYLAPDTPEGQTIIDVLGPWPQRVPVMIALVGVIQFVMLAIWHVVQSVRPAAPERATS